MIKNWRWGRPGNEAEGAAHWPRVQYEYLINSTLNRVFIHQKIKCMSCPRKVQVCEHTQLHYYCSVQFYLCQSHVLLQLSVCSVFKTIVFLNCVTLFTLLKSWSLIIGKYNSTCTQAISAFCCFLPCLILQASCISSFWLVARGLSMRLFHPF